MAKPSQLHQFAALDRFQNPPVAIEQSRGHPGRVGEPGQQPFHFRPQVGDGSRQFPRVTRFSMRRAGDLPRRDPVNDLQQFRNPFPEPSRCRDHRHAQPTRQLPGIHGEAVPLRLVHEIQADHHPVGDLHHLQGQVEIAFQARGVHHDQRHIRLAEQHEVSGNLLIRARRQQRIRAGQIDELVAAALKQETTLSARDGLPRPVARVLTQSGQRVEHRALAHIRIAGQSHDVFRLADVHSHADQLHRIVRRTRLTTAVGHVRITVELLMLTA